MIYGHVAQTQGRKLSSVSSSVTKSLLDLLDEHPVKIRSVISCIDLKLGLFTFLCQTNGLHSAKVIAAVYLFDFRYLCKCPLESLKMCLYVYIYIYFPTSGE